MKTFILPLILQYKNVWFTVYFDDIYNCKFMNDDDDDDDYIYKTNIISKESSLFICQNDDIIIDFFLSKKWYLFSKNISRILFFDQIYLQNFQVRLLFYICIVLILPKKTFQVF